MSPITIYVLGCVLVEFVLSVGAAYYANKLTKFTGAFRGWIFVIIAILFFAFQNLFSVIEVAAFLPDNALTGLASSIGYSNLIFSGVLSLCFAGFLFFAMLELYKAFSKVAQESQTERFAPEISEQIIQS